MVQPTEHGLKIKGDGLFHEQLELREEYSGLKFGPELEFFVVDAATLKPKDCLDELAGMSLFGTKVKPELAAEQIEITVGPQYSLPEMERELKSVIQEVQAALEVRGASLLPVALYDTQPLTITPNARYELLIQHLGEAFRMHAPTVASDQLNIGAENSEQAARIFNSVRMLLPEAIALTGASPFRHGKANGIASNRLDVYDAAIGKFPQLTGLPAAYAERDFFQNYAQHVEDLPVFQHPNMMYHYVRPMPQRGVAAEIRCLDKQPTLSGTMAVYAFSKAVVAFVEETRNTTPKTISHRDRPHSGKYSPLATIISRDEEAIQQALGKARREGSTLFSRSDALLLELRGYLGPQEGHYLDHLSQRAQESGVISQLVPVYKRDGLEAAHRSVQQAFLQDLRR